MIFARWKSRPFIAPQWFRDYRPPTLSHDFRTKKEQGGFSTVVTLLISPHLDMSALRRKYGIVFTVIGFSLMIAGAIMGAYNLLK